MSPENDPTHDNDEARPHDFDAQTAANVAVMKWIDRSRGLRRASGRGGTWIESNTLGSFEPLDVIEGRMPYPASGVSIDPRDGRMIISTLEGLHWVDLDDWVIRGIKGEFYPCKPDIFEATYEAVELGITKGAEAADGAQ